MSGHSSARHANCQNCGAPLAGPYCSVCGQHDVEYHRSLWPMLEDALEGFFHFDGKAVKSVRFLLTRPGFLTQEFVAGRRASYANPLRLYIFISFLFFAVGALLTHRPTRAEREAREKEAAQASQDVSSALRGSPELKKKIEATKESAAAGAIDSANASATVTPKPTPTRIKSPVSFSFTKGTPDEDGEFRINVSDDPKNLGVVNRYLRERLGPNGHLDPNAVKAEVSHFLPPMLFLCLPLLALVLMVAYKGTHHFYIEHLVFALHLQAFIFFLAFLTKIAAKLVALLSPGTADLLQTAVFLFGTWLVYCAFRRFYGQRRWATAVKLILIAGAYSVILILGIVAVSIGSVMVVLQEA
jgi:hypothetical protein